MGYATDFHKKGETVQSDLEDLLVKVIPFAQKLAGQRAMFALFVPDLKALGMKKKRDDPSMTNVDGEFDDRPEEQEGKVRYVVKPGLVKFGTGTGQKLDQKKTILVQAFVELYSDSVNT